MQRLQDAIGKEGVWAAWKREERPASVMSYYFRILSDNKATSKGILREQKTLCAVLDLLALDRPRQAADVVAQRLASPEFATKDCGLWEVAEFAELVPKDGAQFMNKSMSAHVEEGIQGRHSSRSPGVGKCSSRTGGGRCPAPGMELREELMAVESWEREKTFRGQGHQRKRQRKKQMQEAVSEISEKNEDLGSVSNDDERILKLASPLLANRLDPTGERVESLRPRGVS